MDLLIVSVKDRALDAFNRPFFVPSRGMAIRSFQDEINRTDGDMYKHPDDYDLYFLGTFNDMTGAFVSVAPEQIAIGKQMVIKESN